MCVSHTSFRDFSALTESGAVQTEKILVCWLCVDTAKEATEFYSAANPGHSRSAPVWESHVAVPG